MLYHYINLKIRSLEVLDILSPYLSLPLFKGLLVGVNVMIALCMVFLLHDKIKKVFLIKI